MPRESRLTGPAAFQAACATARQALACRARVMAVVAVFVGLVATMAAGHAGDGFSVRPPNKCPSTAPEGRPKLAGELERSLAADGVGDPDPLTPGSARVVEQAGACTLGRPGAVEVIALSVGMELAAGDAITCGTGSHLTLEFEDRSQLRVQPGSRIHLGAS